MILLQRASHKGQKGNLPGALDGQAQFALVLCTGTGDPAGDDFSPFSNELFECFGVFVINFNGAVYAESANFAALIEPVFSAASLTFIHIGISFVLELFFGCFGRFSRLF